MQALYTRGLSPNYRIKNSIYYGGLSPTKLNPNKSSRIFKIIVYNTSYVSFMLFSSVQCLVVVRVIIEESAVIVESPTLTKE